MKRNSVIDSPKVIGLTGGIGSGKSTVSDYLAKKGFSVVDADKIGKEIMSEKETIYEVADCFGKGILDDEGNVDRKKLREIVFSNETDLKKLNAIFHGKIRRNICSEVERLKNEGKNVIFIDAPLLIENNIDRMVDEVWIVSCDVETQITRVMERDGSSREDAVRIIGRQMPLKEKLKYADLILVNQNSISELLAEVEKALQELIKRI